MAIGRLLVRQQTGESADKKDIMANLLREVHKAKTAWDAARFSVSCFTIDAGGALVDMQKVEGLHTEHHVSMTRLR